MEKKFVEWYLLNTQTHEVLGPYDIVQVSIRLVSDPNLTGGDYLVKQDIVNDLVVKTTFKGIDLNRLDDDVLPQFFETTVEGQDWPVKTYENYLLAVLGHKIVVDQLGIEKYEKLLIRI